VQFYFIFHLFHTQFTLLYITPAMTLSRTKKWLLRSGGWGIKTMVKREWISSFITLLQQWTY